MAYSAFVSLAKAESCSKGIPQAHFNFIMENKDTVFNLKGKFAKYLYFDIWLPITAATESEVKMPTVNILTDGHSPHTLYIC